MTVYGGAPPGPLFAGYEVYADDGERIGTITEVRDNHFRIDPGSGQQFWLLDICVAAIYDNRANLSLPAAAIEQFKVQVPFKP
jgi:sporulation protein YlmC with PRC-barrel domain